MTRANLSDLELASLEAAKIRFQQNVSSLLEIELELDRKHQFAKTKGKDVIFLDAAEVQILTKHLRTVSSELLGSYDLINHAAKHLIFQNRLSGSFADQIRRELNWEA